MKVFKFGGASVNSADAVRNMANIVAAHLGDEPLVVVVSAMGKTTNLLEKLVPAPGQQEADLRQQRQQLEAYHRDIAAALMPGNDGLQRKIDTLLADLDGLCASLPADAEHYNYNYDQVVSHGELLSTTIIADYLNHLGINTQWVDARQVIVTDHHHREGRVDWEATCAKCNLFNNLTKGHQVALTQGFIAATSDMKTTTLGREGSDYSAAILAYCLKAESITIWKDVPGFLNADPKYFSDTVKISQIPYNEAIELAYYGASVIHPKTVKPIQNLGIPLFIRSFITPEAEGSAIGDYRTIVPETPLYIFKNNQILLSILPRDFSFIAEDNLQIIFGILNEVGIKVNLMQNSALSFSICIDNNPQRVGVLIDRLSGLFRVRYNERMQLVTIRYYNQQVIDRIVAGRPVLLEQRSRLTEQLVVPENIAEKR
ncbi:MAG: aspartate kinase [Bacteroidales bacterium]|nr:aspartate kinase [Bacteroidales bacterium]